MKLQFIVFVLVVAVSCNKDTSRKNLKFGLPVEQMKVDTTGDGVMDTWGYYLNDPGNIRIIYEEIDKNLDGFSDELIWAGSAVFTPKDRAEKEVVKVHEEVDTDYDGKVDTIKWLLPNDFYALAQSDTDRDGYFETTSYYSFKKNIVRKEKDTNKDGKPDVILWETRGEIDTDFDSTPDKFVIAKSNLELEEIVKDKTKHQSLSEKNSWFLNQNLVPENERSIIGSGYFVNKTKK
ncbi:MAG: hypothetical protein L6Q54_04990 [Leptospiraceae bacterium]|nr:hypothetical protein [Leptospiraceae bacterium]MCK6380593.1 hypothetical protein [Leptospiraceae bacterium]NUM42580.1 hypothetical protein [Leptospiraceae bacterium]